MKIRGYEIEFNKKYIKSLKPRELKQVVYWCLESVDENISKDDKNAILEELKKWN